MWLPSVLAYGLILLTNASRCPEPKKPHPTSCTVFYSCANLPGGGYVWIPSRCMDGLVFQPYLRMCVVPGDIWTCDTLSTESPSLATKTHGTPNESIDPTNVNYLGYTRDPAEFSETIDSSYVVDDITDTATEAATPYPLIEFDESVATTHGNKKGNYPHKCTSDARRPVPLPLMQKYHDIVSDHYKLLNELTNRLHIYKELSAAISDSLSIEDLSIRNTTTVNPTRTVAVHNRKQNISLNYLVQIERNELRNDGKPIEIMENDKSTTDGDVTTSTTGSASGLLSIDDLNPDDIIAIIDNLGNRRYLTIDGYKTVAQRLTPQQFIGVISCSRHVRLPNRTDCGKYYTCDPKTASVVEYSCPPHMSFNAHSRICDTESAKTCRDGKPPSSEIYLERVEEHRDSSRDENSGEEETEEPCRERGKMKDPASDSNYYICYSMPGSEQIKSVRMMCPNALIFCQSKRVCTTRQLCGASR